MTDPVQRSNPQPQVLSAKARLQGGKKEGDTGKPDKLQRACRDFESIFIQQMLQQMRQTVPQNGLFSGGQAEQMYTSMLDGELSKSIAQERGLGLADMMYRQLSAIQNYADEKKK